mmetsp:Transcript_23568/g.67383  ORF Transcript_23568/g.67383 Transcript_23568/m.67383 type:complete len:208 (+) Transcript_23568:142-765(+)
MVCPCKLHEAPQLPLEHAKPFVDASHHLFHLGELAHGGCLALAALELPRHALGRVAYSEHVLGLWFLLPEPEDASLELGHADPPVAVLVQELEELGGLVTHQVHVVLAEILQKLLVLNELSKVLQVHLVARNGKGAVEGLLKSVHKDPELLILLSLPLLRLRCTDLRHVVDDDARQQGEHCEGRYEYVGNEEDPHPGHGVGHLTGDE